jgi:tetratricopeptide (TPR) repeat protein
MRTIYRPVACLLAVALTLCAGCHSSARLDATYPGGAEAPLFTEMGDHHRPVDTKSSLAQRYFDQGLTWAFAFNHDEAIRSFTQAAKFDPRCAMAWWGIAFCNGPHINNPAMTPERSVAAWDALQKAVELAYTARPVDQALIRALEKRYASPPPADRRPLDEAFASAMREVHRQYPNDVDVATLTAEAIMDLWPWNLWTLDGKPQPDTLEIVGILELVLKRDPRHPGATHLYIHAVEASPHPDKANAAADTLRALVPASGHLVHMPSHIDVRTGRYQMAADQNARAISVDRRYRELSPHQEFYRLYMLHNDHFLAYASMMEGRSETAVSAARQMIASIPEDFAVRNGPLVDAYTMIVVEALMRFGRWDEVLREPAPPSYLPITTAFWRFARGIAYAARGDVPQAEREQAEFRAAVARVPAGAMMAQNPASDVLPIADRVLAAEIAFRRGQLDQAVTLLNEAIPMEDHLRYIEPPDWVQPVRQTLGAFLVSAGRDAEAEKVYRDDLSRWPENGWSLYGLARCLEAQGRTAEARQVRQRFEKAWARADIEITSSCMCVAAAVR